MNRATRTTTLLLATACAALTTAVAPTALAASVLRAHSQIGGRYIVVLREDGLQATYTALGTERSLADSASEIARLHGGVARATYAAALRGFSFEGSAREAEALSHDPAVAYVAEDGRVSLAGVQAPVPSWGLDRIDQRSPALDSSYAYSSEGLGVDLYIVDTGILSTHQEFDNRVDVANGFSTVADGRGTEDCNGHGTLVAGIAAGSTYGVAKAATLHPVRVFDCLGQGALSDVIAAVDWIAARYPAATRRGKTPPPTGAVVNMSLNAGFSQPLDDAIANSIARGITYVVAAGNDAFDACFVSPARASGAITVGASESGDRRYAISNIGACVDVFAPGRDIVSSFIRSDSDAIPFSGTSAAAPHVAGAAALVLAANPNARPQDVQAAIQAAATPGALQDVGEGSPNLLLYSAFAGNGEDYPPVAAFTVACADRRCAFDASGSGDDWSSLSYRWDLGDGRRTRGMTADHRYRTTTSAGIVVTLTVTDSSGQTSTVVRSLDGAW